MQHKCADLVGEHIGLIASLYGSSVSLQLSRHFNVKKERNYRKNVPKRDKKGEYV